MAMDVYPEGDFALKLDKCFTKCFEYVIESRMFMKISKDGPLPPPLLLCDTDYLRSSFELGDLAKRIERDSTFYLCSPRISS